MTATLGIVAAFLAFLSWGIGDFAIQRSVRAVGTFAALFCITAFGSVILLPLVWNDLHILATPQGRNIILLTVAVTLVTALVEFEAFRRGKLSVIEPIMSFELVVTAAIGIFVLGEEISPIQALLAFVVFVGIALTVVHHEPRRFWDFWNRRSGLERGVLLGAIGMFLMSATNIVTGLASQRTNPLLAIWGIHFGLAVITFVWMFIRGSLGTMVRQVRRAWKPVLAESIFDNAAWISFAFAVSVIPISITVAITESYIALAALLGIAFNKERLQRHQYIGMLLALGSAITLAVVSAR